MFANVKIDQSTCIGCGQCSIVCSKKILKMNQDSVEVLHFENWGCCQCGICMAVCPSKSILVSGLDYNSFNKLPETKIPYEDLIEFLSSRRSVRRFSKKPLSDEVIQNLVKASAMAPIGAPPTNVKLLVIRDKNTLDELFHSIVVGWKKLMVNIKNPFYRFVLKLKAGANKYNALQKHALPAAKIYCDSADNKKNVFTFDAPSLFLFYGEKNSVCITENCWLSCSFSIIAAHAIGLGSVLSGMLPPIINMNKSIKAKIGIPKDHDIFGCLMLGWPDSDIEFRRSVPRTLAKVKIINES